MKDVDPDHEIAIILEALGKLASIASGLGQLTLLNEVEVNMHDIRKTFEEEPESP